MANNDSTANQPVVPDITYSDVGTDVSEMFESVNEHWASESSSASLTLKCKWGERMIIISNLLMRKMEEGMQCATYPVETQGMGEQLKLLDVDVSPFPTNYQKAGQGIEYEFAKLTLHYGTLIPEISYQPTSEYWTINPAGLKYDLGNGNKQPVPPEEAPGILVFGHTLTITAKRINLDNFNLEDWEGKVNLTEVDGTQFGGGGLLRAYPPGTLLCCAPGLTKHAIPGYYNATFTFNYRSIPWNKFYYPQANKTIEQSLVSMVDENGNTIKIYPEKDLNPLFNQIGILTAPQEEL